jgi:hypothetical protein
MTPCCWILRPSTVTIVGLSADDPLLRFSRSFNTQGVSLKSCQAYAVSKPAASCKPLRSKVYVRQCFLFD